MCVIRYPDSFQPICTRELVRPEPPAAAVDDDSRGYPDRLPEWLAAREGEPVPPGAD